MSPSFVPSLIFLLFVSDSFAFALDNDRLKSPEANKLEKNPAGAIQKSTSENTNKVNQKTLPSAAIRFQKAPPGATFSFDADNNEWHQRNDSLKATPIGEAVHLAEANPLPAAAIRPSIAVVPQAPRPRIGQSSAGISAPKIIGESLAHQNNNQSAPIPPVWVPLVKGHETLTAGDNATAVLQRADHNQLGAIANLDHRKPSENVISPINSFGKRGFWEGLPFDFSGIFGSRSSKDPKRNGHDENPAHTKSQTINSTLSASQSKASESPKNALNEAHGQVFSKDQKNIGLLSPREKLQRLGSTTHQRSRQDSKQPKVENNVPKLKSNVSKRVGNPNVKEEQVKIETNLVVNPTDKRQSSNNFTALKVNPQVRAVADGDTPFDRPHESEIIAGNSPSGAQKNATKCEDLAENCASNRAFCRVAPYATLMWKNCANTCNFCNGEKISPEKLPSPAKSRKRIEPFTNLVTAGNVTITDGALPRKSSKGRRATVCRDSSPRCALWTAKGFCASRFFLTEIKLRFCASSCNLCHLLNVQKHLAVPSVEEEGTSAEDKNTEHHADGKDHATVTKGQDEQRVEEAESKGNKADSKNKQKTENNGKEADSKIHEAESQTHGESSNETKTNVTISDAHKI